MNFAYTLQNEEDSTFFAQTLAKLMLEKQFFPALFFIGDLGCGKTFMTRKLCQSLPDSHLAEISSPSFSLTNFYPTQPPVCHADLYRLEFADVPEDLEEAFNHNLVIVEWAERLPDFYYNFEHILIDLTKNQDQRFMKIKAKSEKTLDFLAELNKRLILKLSAIEHLHYL